MIFRLANGQDDQAIRRFLRDSVMPGHVRLIYTREPSAFDSFRRLDPDVQILIADDNGALVGMGCRAVRRLYVNGRPRDVGYLSGLRLALSAQRGLALGRGYAALKQLHEANPVTFYLTTIIDGNARAQATLTSGRGALPAYHPLGRYLTHLCAVRCRGTTAPQHNTLRVQPASAVPADDLSHFFSTVGPGRQFFPAPGSNGYGRRLLTAVGRENVLVATRGGRIVGTMGLWDQTEYKQHTVAGYTPWFGLLRPCLNFGLRLAGRHTLPSPGQQIRTGSAAMVCIEHNDLEVFNLLLRHVLHHACVHGLHQVAVGLHEGDPYVPAMKSFAQAVYRSDVYLVSWGDGSADPVPDDSPVPYLELGAL